MKKVFFAILILMFSFSLVACVDNTEKTENDVQFSGAKDIACYVDQVIDLTEGVSATNNGEAVDLANVYVVDSDGVPCIVEDRENFSLSEPGEYIVTYIVTVGGGTEYNKDVSLTVASKDVILDKDGTNPTMIYFGQSITFAEVTAKVSAIDDTPVSVERTVMFDGEDLNVTENTFTPTEKGKYTVTYYAENDFGAEYSATLTDTFIVATAAPANLLNGFENGVGGISEEDAVGAKFTSNENLEYVASGIKSLKITTAGIGGSPVFDCNAICGTNDLSQWASISFDVRTEPGVSKYIGFSFVFLDSWTSVTFGVTATEEWTTCSLDLTTLPNEKLKNVWAFRIYVANDSVYYLDNFVFAAREHDSTISAGESDAGKYEIPKSFEKKLVTPSVEDWKDNDYSIFVTVTDPDGTAVLDNVPFEENVTSFTPAKVGRYKVVYKLVNSSNKISYSNELIYNVYDADDDPVITVDGQNAANTEVSLPVTIKGASAVMSPSDSRECDVTIEIKNAAGVVIETLTKAGGNFVFTSAGKYKIVYSATNPNSERTSTVEHDIVAYNKAPQNNVFYHFEDDKLNGMEDSTCGATFAINNDVDFVKTGLKSLKITAANDGFFVLNLSGMNLTSLKGLASISMWVYNPASAIGFDDVWDDVKTWVNVYVGAQANNGYTQITLDLLQDKLLNLSEKQDNANLTYAIRFYVGAAGTYYIDDIEFTEREDEIKICPEDDKTADFSETDRYYVDRLTVINWNDTAYTEKLTVTDPEGNEIIKDEPYAEEKWSFVRNKLGDYRIEISIVYGEDITLTESYVLNVSKAKPVIVLSGENVTKIEQGGVVTVAAATGKVSASDDTALDVDIDVFDKNNEPVSLDQDNRFTATTVGEYKIVYTAVNSATSVSKTIENIVKCYVKEPGNLLAGFEDELPANAVNNDTGTNCVFSVNENLDNVASGLKSLKIQSEGDGKVYFDCAALFGSADLSAYSSISMKVKTTAYFSIYDVFYNGTWNLVDIGTPATAEWKTLTLDLSGIDDAHLSNVWAIRMYVAPNSTFYIDDITFA